MMDEFLVLSQVADGKCIKFDGNLDAFYRMAILYWKPLKCKDKECESPYGGKDDCELRNTDFCCVN